MQRLSIEARLPRADGTLKRKGMQRIPERHPERAFETLVQSAPAEDSVDEPASRAAPVR